MSQPIDAYLESACAAARAAGTVIKQRLGKPQTTEFKSLTDPVTEVDRQCEILIRDLLTAAHPEVDFWGEEFGHSQQMGPLVWLVDPLDGTKNFVHGYPYVAVSIALVENGRSKLGVVYDPLRDELFHARRGKGAFSDSIRLEVSRTEHLHEALVVPGFTTAPARQKELIWKAALSCQGIRRGGAAALDLCQLAAGRIDAVWEWSLKPWDLAAATLVIEESKGTVSRIDGQQFDMLGGQILATNTSLHRAFVELLNQ